MNLSSFTLGRSLRLALLLLMLASQGIVSVHALDAAHHLDTDNCPTCVIGHGLGAALDAVNEGPLVQAYRVIPAMQPTVAAGAARVTSQFARAPPGALWNTPGPN